MRLLKKINNNYAIALDSKGEEIIVAGRGIGFNKMPCEIKDLSVIDQTFYDIDSSYYDLLKNIPENLIEISAEIVKLVKRKIKSAINPNLTFSLADHISFCITRHKKKIYFKMPLAYEIEQHYPIETQIGFQALKLIRKECGITLRDSEAYGIAINIINAEVGEANTSGSLDTEKLIDCITGIVEEEMDIKIDRHSFNYTRYATHMHHLFQRIEGDNQVAVINSNLYEALKNECPAAYRCTVKISDFLEEVLKCDLCQEEKLYIVLHVDRLTLREDCNR